MIKTYSVICVCLLAVTGVLGQSRSKPVKQPAEVIEAYRVCNEFQRILAVDLDFDRAFEATFTKDPARRREIAIAEGEFGSVDLSKVDDATLIAIYKNQTQLFLLIAPLLYASEGDEQSVFPPAIDGLLDRLRPQDQKDLNSYLVQLKQGVRTLRAHLDKLVATNIRLADKLRDLKNGLKEPLAPPLDHVVKPLTAFSHGQVLSLDAEYYQIGDYSVIREAGQMRLIRFRLFSIRW
jgi:hypothetical protein